MPDPITTLAVRLLDEKLDPVPRYRLLRDVLHEPEESADRQSAYAAAMQTEQVLWLSAAQLPDGSWGHFHPAGQTAGYRTHAGRPQTATQAVRSTEAALIRALSLGMEANHPTLARLRQYLEKLLDGSQAWPDRRISDKSQAPEIQLMAAARLRQLDPEHPDALAAAAPWTRLLTAAFDDGTFNALHYMDVYETLFGEPAIQGTTPGLSAYALILLRDLLPFPVEERLIRHLVFHNRGIAWIHNRSMQHLPLDFPSGEAVRYLEALELLAAYPGAGELLEEASDWLWDQMNPGGGWDLGQAGHDGVILPLSGSWRPRRARRQDSTIRILALLQHLQMSCDLRRVICHNR